MSKGKLYNLRRKLQVLAYDLTSPEFVSKIYFRLLLKYPLNLKNPQTFNEKIQWLKLYKWPNDPLVIQCADKYRVRQYLEEKGMDNYLNTLLGVWDNANDIDFDKLPNRFALKCTHGARYNIICDNKTQSDIKNTRKKINTWLKEDFGKFNAEPHYSKMKPRVIAEQFLDDGNGDLTDYKFYCFHGKVQFMYISKGLGKRINMSITFFDVNGNLAPYHRTDFQADPNVKIPSTFGKMKNLSEILASPFPFVRVDWFEVNGKIYFGELTFTPCGGLMGITPLSYDKKLGTLLELPDKKL